MGRQMLLFSNPDLNAVEHTTASSELKILTWNLQNPSLERAKKQLDWLLAAQADVLILTEATSSEGSLYIINSLEGLGFQIAFKKSTYDKYSTAICSKGFNVRNWDISFFSSRLEAVILKTHFGDLYILGMYAPSSWGNMTQERVSARLSFQNQVIKILQNYKENLNIIIGGDLNILEPNHKPIVPGFEDHTFYTNLQNLDFIDVYRLFYPDQQEYSWYSSTRIGLRLDHFFAMKGLSRQIKNCYYDHSPRYSKLSDHSAMCLEFLK